MVPMEYGTSKFYFHFRTDSGFEAALPMTKELAGFEGEVKGVPEAVRLAGHGPVFSIASGYRCANCQKVFFAADLEGLKHECSRDRGVPSSIRYAF